MNRSVRRLAAGSFLVAMLGIPSTARAEWIDFRGVGHAANVSIRVMSGTTTLFNGTVAAGELNWAWLGATPAGYATNFFTYCIDALNYLRDPQLVTLRASSEISPATNPSAGAKVAWLFEAFADGIRSGGTNTQAAALQVAIWEAMYDATQNLTGGTFRLNTTGAVREQANAYLTALYSAPYSGHSTTWLDTQAGQDQITRRSIPEPSTLLLLIAAGVFMGRRRVARLRAERQ
jgi:hypothetical protein